MEDIEIIEKTEKTEEAENKTVAKKETTLPQLAVSFDVASVICFLLGICFVPFGIFISLILWLATLVCPVVAIIMGVCALCRGKKKIGTAGLIQAICAIAVPVVVVVTLIILFSTGVAVIRFM